MGLEMLFSGEVWLNDWDYQKCDGGWQPERVPGRGTQPTTRAKQGQYQRCETHTRMILSGPGTPPKLSRHQAQYKEK